MSSPLYLSGMNNSPPQKQKVIDPAATSCTADTITWEDADKENLVATTPCHPTESPPKEKASPYAPADSKNCTQQKQASQLSPLGSSRKRSFVLLQDSNGEEKEERIAKSPTMHRGHPLIEIYADDDCTDQTGQEQEQEKKVEDAASITVDHKSDEDMSTILHMTPEESSDDVNNDSMEESRLSTFSAFPSDGMTVFAELREPRLQASPSKSPIAQRERAADQKSPNSARRNNLGRRLLRGYDDGSSPISSTPSEQTGHSNLLDFTPRLQQQRTPAGQSPLKVATSTRKVPPARGSGATTSKLSLLDFDIPPAPTPRSIPSVTPRELESLKSGYLSEISSLKATLSGREAEVASLKQSVADAERRVGEALEEGRTESACREALALEQAEWVERSKEMETIIKNLRAEMTELENERGRMTNKAEEAEKGKEQLEGQIVELESRLSGARESSNGKKSSNNNNNNNSDGGEETVGSKTPEETAAEVQDAVEKVARELHTLYKGKHETKVAALKKSYEARWEKRVCEAEAKLQAALARNESLTRAEQQRGGADPSMMVHVNNDDELEADRRVLEAQIKGLQQEITAIKEESKRLREEIATERAEKGDLVAVVDEWLAMQQSQSAAGTGQATTATAADDNSNNNNNAMPRSVSNRGSGLRPPSTVGVEKRLPMYTATPGRPRPRANSGGRSGIAVYTPGRVGGNSGSGGIMSSIERMGRSGA